MRKEAKDGGTCGRSEEEAKTIVDKLKENGVRSAYQFLSAMEGGCAKWEEKPSVGKQLSE